MAFIQYRRDKYIQPAAAPTLLSMYIAMAFAPAAVFATEETVIVEGAGPADTIKREEQDYSVKTTTAGTKCR